MALDPGRQARRQRQDARAAELRRQLEDRALALADADPDDPHLQEVAGSIRDHREMAARRAEWEQEQ
jgi:hypothetical protein